MVASEKNGNNRDDGNDRPKRVKTDRIPFAIPEEIAYKFLSPLSRLDYPAISTMCRELGRIINKPELYYRRSLHGNPETILYALIGFPEGKLPRWYVLNANHRLGEINNLPDMPYGAAVVTIGHDIYVIGGAIDEVPRTDVLVIDTRFHRIRELEKMKQPRYRPAAGVIDGKIYVFGGCKYHMHSSEYAMMEVFNVTTGKWASWMFGNPDYSNFYITSAVVQDQLLMLGPHYGLKFHPLSNRWDVYWGSAPSSLRSLWQASCVPVYGGLCTIDTTCSVEGSPIVVFNFNSNSWKPVHGVTLLELPTLHYYDSKMAFSGHTLLILGTDEDMNIWSIDISLDTSDGASGTTYTGTVDTVQRVLTTSRKLVDIEHCRFLTIQ